MKIFVIHSGADREIVKGHISTIENATVNSEILLLKNGGKLWKLDAKKMIKQAQMVLVFVGKHSASSTNIAWEIETAKKAQKQLITVKLGEFELPESLFTEDNYSREKINCSMMKSVDEVIEFLNAYSETDYALFNGEKTNLDTKVLLEQYKIFLQTSETLVARRQSVNSFYITVNSALISVFSVIAALGFEVTMKCFIGAIFAMIGIILCISWMRILNSYGTLNASKMKIISLIEKQLPANLYDAEWRAQSDKLNKRPYVSFTSSEIRIPKIFIGVYIILILCVVIAAIVTLFA